MTGGANEAWSYGDAAYERITAALRLRERLRPYIHQQMHAASQTGLPPMRPLFVDFPADPGAWDIDDQFMFGPDLLIAPVLVPGAAARDVYFPAGPTWIAAGTVERHEGGSVARVSLSPDRIPVFAREGAKVLDVFR
jgi:alpha-D-xyloside xylohydrolase